MKTQDALLQNQKEIISQQQEVKKQNDEVLNTVSTTQSEFLSFIVSLLLTSHIE